MTYHTLSHSVHSEHGNYLSLCEIPRHELQAHLPPLQKGLPGALFRDCGIVVLLVEPNSSLIGGVAVQCKPLAAPVLGSLHRSIAILRRAFLEDQGIYKRQGRKAAAVRANKAERLGPGIAHSQQPGAAAPLCPVSVLAE